MKIIKVNEVLIDVTMSHPEYGNENFTIGVIYDFPGEEWDNDFKDIFKEVVEKYDPYNIYFDYEFTIEYRFENRYIQLVYNYHRGNEEEELIKKTEWNMIKQ